MTPTQLKVLSQGGVVVNTAGVHVSAPGIVAIAIDLKTKWARVDLETSSERDGPTLSLGLKSDLRSEPTLICLPAFVGWDIWCSEASRYTVYLCLVKCEKE